MRWGWVATTASAAVWDHEGTRAVYAIEDCFERVRVGNPAVAGTHLGPIISPKQFQSIEKYVAIGRRESIVPGPGVAWLMLRLPTRLRP